MNSRLSILFVVVLFFIAFRGAGQSNKVEQKINVSIPEVALLGLVVESNAGTGLQANASNEAGDQIQFKNANEKSVWINYSSIVSRPTAKRKVVAFIQGGLPKGVHLKVEASEYSGVGNGKLGESAGAVSLSGQPSDVIVGIGTCFTGKGGHSGHCLRYNLEQDKDENSIAMISNQNQSVNVIYTLTDCN